VLEWVTVRGSTSGVGKSQYITSLPGQLSLAITQWVGTANTSRRAVMLCGLGVKAGVICMWVASKNCVITLLLWTISERFSNGFIQVRLSLLNKEKFD